MASRIRTKSRKSAWRSASLRSVFPDDDMHAQSVRLLVLFEDLKIETSGINKRKMPSLSTTNDSQYPQRYFLRRAIATVDECANCMIVLNKDPQFKRVKQQTFSEDARVTWEAAISVCRKKSDVWLIKSIRNDVGGHFGVKAARRAVNSLKEGTRGSIDYRLDLRKPRQIIDCNFVGEITARAFVQDRDKNPEEEFRKLVKVFVRAQEAISKAIVYLIYGYVWPRLGRF